MRKGHFPLRRPDKGVTVDAPGDYRITFRYVPKNWPRNLTLCALGAVLLLVSLWLALRHRSPASPPSLPATA